MSNNNNKNHQPSPTKDPRKHYPHQHQDRTYDHRRNQINYYPPTFNDPNDQMRNGAEYFNRIPSYPPPPQYYHPSYNSYPYGHPNSYANHLTNNPYNNNGRMPNPNPYYYSTGHQYPHQEMRVSQQSIQINQQASKLQKTQMPSQGRSQKESSRLKYDDSKKQLNLQKEQEDRKERNFKRQTKRQSDQQSLSYRSYESSVSQSQQEEVFYKRKVIAKRKDPVLDSKEEIRKWIQARRKNYPRKSLITEGEEKEKTSQEEMSLLQKKIRKKLVLINSDPRSIIKKQKDLDILRRFILYPRRQRRIFTKTQKYPDDKPLIQEIEPEHIKKDLEEAGSANLKEVQTPKVNQEVKSIEEIAPTPKKRESEDQENEVAMEVPIRAGQPLRQQSEKREVVGRGHKQLSVQVIINHLQMKQREDSKLLENLMDYKSNSCQYRYQYQTLETNLLLDNVFRDTSYMLQAIRYIVKHNFFQ